MPLWSFRGLRLVISDSLEISASADVDLSTEFGGDVHASFDVFGATVQAGLSAGVSVGLGLTIGKSSD